MKRKKRIDIPKRLKDQQGLSLAEVMVTVVLFLLVAGALYLSASAGQNSWQVNTAQIQLQSELRKAMEWMKYDLIQAGPSSILDVPADGAGYSTITFQIPSTVSGGSIVWDSDRIIFALGGADGTQLLRRKGADVKVIAQNVQTLQFTRQIASSNILEIALTGQKADIKGTPLSYQLSFQVKLRN